MQEAPEEEDGEEEREEESITISNIAALDSIQNTVYSTIYNKILT